MVVRRGEASAEDIKRISDRLLPTIRKAIRKPFHVTICEGSICELHRVSFAEEEKPMTIVVGVESVNFFWKEYGQSLEKTIRNILVHESLHVLGMEHDKSGYKQGFYSNPNKDTYTPMIERKIFGD